MCYLQWHIQVVVQAPPIPTEPNPDVDAGVIEDARRRQRRHRYIGVLALAAAVGVGLVAGFGGGSGGNDLGGGQAQRPNAPGQGGTGAHQASAGFPGAPASQKADGVSSWLCPLAPANRYLPARSGCVTAMRADLTGDGRDDLVLVYSHLNHTTGYYSGGPAKWKHYFRGNDATVEVVLPGGKRISARLATQYRGRAYPVHAAKIIAVKQVSSVPGDEIFLQISQISSGSNAVAYGYNAGRLVAAGVLLGYGGDSGARAGFTCKRTAQPPELVQRVFVLGARGFAARWKETELTYAWHGLKLLKIKSRTLAGNRNPPRSELLAAAGCGPLKWVNATPAA